MTVTIKPSSISIADGRYPAAITSDTKLHACGVVEKKLTIVRKLCGLGINRTQSFVIRPKVPSLPQINPGRSNAPDSYAPSLEPQVRTVPSASTISSPSTWLDVTKSLSTWMPPAFVAALPPTVLARCDDG